MQFCELEFTESDSKCLDTSGYASLYKYIEYLSTSIYCLFTQEGVIPGKIGMFVNQYLNHDIFGEQSAACQQQLMQATAIRR